MRIFKSAIVALTLVLPTTAFAAGTHHPKGLSMGPAAEQSGMMMTRGMMMRCPLGGAHVEGALAFLQAELKITPSQKKAWETFAATYREVAPSRGAPMMGSDMMDGESGPNKMMAAPFPDRIARHTEMLERHLAAAKRLQLAAQPLYAVLDANQKKAADELLPTMVMMSGM